ncbi:unnamed protein product [Prorocentrum cordatum]|uniref:Importin subunit alpha n=1 Tax=Prorocentrum cordatum TaxID=2364126 RepID=A0ABN9Y015_9DINO|nr:unnamed protein product [Polarella glacialis]
MVLQASPRREKGGAWRQGVLCVLPRRRPPRSLLGPPGSSVSRKTRDEAHVFGKGPRIQDLLPPGPVSPMTQASERVTLLRNATWTLSNLCRGKPLPPFEWVSPALGTLASLIHSADVEVLANACWNLSYLADGPNNWVEAVTNAGVCPRLVELLSHSSPLVQTSALRAVGNVATGLNRQTQVILESCALPALLKLLAHTSRAIRKEACWTISNITAGSQEQIQEVIDQGLMVPVIGLLQTGDFDVKKEAAWAIRNALSGGSQQHIEHLVARGCTKPMMDLLSIPDVKITAVALEAVEIILNAGKRMQLTLDLPENPFCTLVEQFEGERKIEALLEDPNEDVYRKARGILEQHFAGDGDDAEIADADAGGAGISGAQVPPGGFAFGGMSIRDDAEMAGARGVAGFLSAQVPPSGFALEGMDTQER